MGFDSHQDTSDGFSSSQNNGRASSCDTTGKPLDSEFAFSDANVVVETSDRLFWVHEYNLSRFSVIARLIREERAKNSSGPSAGKRVRIVCEGASEDFHNTFRVIYESSTFDRPKYDAPILISALRIATVYGYYDMRKSAISQLERITLAPIDRIRLSDELNLPAWEAPAFAVLCQRPEPLSLSEAQILGLERAMEVARIREAAQRNRYIEAWKSGTVPTEGYQPDLPVKHHPLPRCDCRAQPNLISPIAQSVVTCELHIVAPAIMEEYRATLNQRNEFLNRLNALKQHAINEQKDTPDCMKILSVEGELAKVPWIRRVRDVETASP